MPSELRKRAVDIRFMQADILDLGQLEENFDVIEVSGFCIIWRTLLRAGVSWWDY